RCGRRRQPVGRTRGPPGCARGGCASRARCSPSAPTRRASRSRRRGAGRDRSFEHPDAVAQLGGELEVLVFHGAAQLLPQIEQLYPWVRRGVGARSHVALADVLARPVEAAQQIAQVGLERLVALSASQAPGFPEVLEGAAAGGAAQAVRRRGEQARSPLSHCLDEAAQRRLEDGVAGLEALLLGALLAEVKRHFRVVLHLREVDFHLALLAVVAQHHGIASTELTAPSLPSSSSKIRSARPASWRLCVTTMTAVSYSRASRKKTSCRRSALAWSRFPDGSSASTRLGSCTRARATAQRCCSPPDNSLGRCDIRPASPTSESTSSAREVAGRTAIPPIKSGIITFSKAENSRKRWWN